MARVLVLAILLCTCSALNSGFGASERWILNRMDLEESEHMARALAELAVVEEDSLFDDEGYERPDPEWRCKYCHRANDRKSFQLYLACERCLREGCQH